MGFERKIASAALAAASLLSAAPTAAAESHEPLIITPLPEANSGLVDSAEPMLKVVRTRADAGQQPSFEQAMQRLGRAMNQAIRAEQQEMETACKASVRPKPGSAEVYAWGARCSYDRR
jgi:hypothetical protein